MSSGNSRVAKNTIILYFRMIVTLIVALFTSRVILQSLGVTDFGIYNIVGGIVSIMSFLLQSLVVSFQKFFCEAIANHNDKRLSVLMGTSFYILAIIALIVILLVETIGVWFLNNQLVIGDNRMFAANIVLQISTITFLVHLVLALYNAIIISFENMAIYAYLSIFDVTCKLFVAYIVFIVKSDKLIAYSILLLCVQIASLIIYIVYVKNRYKQLNPIFVFSICKHEIRQLLSFTSFSTLGTMSHVIKNQGLNFMLNIFFGPIVNAARAISLQVYTAVSAFTSSFQNAFAPNMMKRCETQSNQEIESVFYTVSKFSFMAMFILSTPIIIFIHPILNTWLNEKNVPEYTYFFTRIVLCIGLVETLSNPAVNIIYAKGKIKGFMVSLSTIVLLILPIAYSFLKFGYNADAAYVVELVMIALAQVIRVYYVKKIYGFEYKNYLKEVVFPILRISIPFTILASLIHFYQFEKFVFAQIILTTILLSITTYFFGTKKTERVIIRNKAKQYASSHFSFFKTS